MLNRTVIALQLFCSSPLRRLCSPAPIALLTALAILLCARPRPGAAEQLDPTSSGGGSLTPSAVTLAKGQVLLTLREDYLHYRHDRPDAVIDRAIEHDHYNALDEELFSTGEIDYGITDDLQVGLNGGYYYGDGFRESDHGGDAEALRYGVATPFGATDVALIAKYRLLNFESGQLAVTGAWKFPLGRSNVRFGDRHRLSPPNQPGSGAYDEQIALTFSRFLTPRITFDVNAMVTRRGEDEDFRIGNAVEIDSAVSYRLTPDIKTVPSFSVFGEISAIFAGKDQSNSERDPNSGGETDYLSIGLWTAINDKTVLTIGPVMPVYQDLNGEQVPAKYRVLMTLTYSL